MSRETKGHEAAGALAIPESGNPELHWGLTKREWFAGMALVGLMASQDWTVIVKMDDVAADAVNTADHLINALNAKDLNA